MTSGSKEKVLVIGGGLGGSLMAVYLARAGYRVEVYERREDPREAGLQGGRSINLAISTRGLHALGGVGLAEKVLSEAVPMKGRMMHSTEGKLTFQPYGTAEGQVINSVSRASLNLTLLEAADQHPNMSLHFDKKCTGVDFDSATVELHDARTGEAMRIQGDVVLGADGAFSAVRSSIQRLDRFDYQQAYLEHGYKELTLPPGPDGGFLLKKNALHIWPRGGFMMIALPNQDGSFTCTLFWPFVGPNSFADLRTEDDVLRYFGEVFPDAVPLIPTLGADYFANPTSSLVTIRCRPWHYRDKVVLLGDACHAVVPFYGQGANAAFEDCVVLDECIREHAPDWQKAFEEYERLRKENADTLADLALTNFVEMRDHVASTGFLAKKRMERAMHLMFPRLFTPLYTMVTFTRMPYTQAVRKARQQSRLMVLFPAAAVFFLFLVLYFVLGVLWE